ncbi:hypothetical protein ACFW6V_25790 [Streptomyces sp. NPDC058734]|uniref:hypothetical protein n=1 Tax=Streptomyces sp. NPDC058734 TaxID=3346615 RepID=UPI0036AD970A
MSFEGGADQGDVEPPCCVVLVMDEGVLDMLDALRDGVTEPRRGLVSEDEARALMILLGALEVEARSEDVRRAAGDLRFRIGSRLS